jgi:hypothetical protein
MFKKIKTWILRYRAKKAIKKINNDRNWIY